MSTDERFQKIKAINEQWCNGKGGGLGSEDIRLLFLAIQQQAQEIEQLTKEREIIIDDVLANVLWEWDGDINREEALEMADKLIKEAMRENK